MLTVTLSHVANRDIRSGGYWVPPKDSGEARNVRVASLREARAKCLAYIDRNELGSGNWIGGAVFKNDVQIANISYNGRIWGMDGKEMQIKATATNKCVKGTCRPRKTG